YLKQVIGFDGTANHDAELDRLALSKAVTFAAVKTGRDDVALLRFTSGLAVFPLRSGATATLLENASPANMIEIIETYKATISFTAPTAYRAMLAAMNQGANLSSLRAAVSAGETLPAPVFNDW